MRQSSRLVLTLPSVESDEFNISIPITASCAILTIASVLGCTIPKLVPVEQADRLCLLLGRKCHKRAHQFFV